MNRWRHSVTTIEILGMRPNPVGYNHERALARILGPDY